MRARGNRSFIGERGLPARSGRHLAGRLLPKTVRQDAEQHELEARAPQLLDELT